MAGLSKHMAPSMQRGLSRTTNPTKMLTGEEKRGCGDQACLAVVRGVIEKMKERGMKGGNTKRGRKIKEEKEKGNIPSVITIEVVQLEEIIIWMMIMMMAGPRYPIGEDIAMIANLI